jgi:hypothetical protein
MLAAWECPAARPRRASPAGRRPRRRRGGLRPRAQATRAALPGALLPVLAGAGAFARARFYAVVAEVYTLHAALSPACRAFVGLAPQWRPGGEPARPLAYLAALLYGLASRSTAPPRWSSAAGARLCLSHRWPVLALPRGAPETAPGPARLAPAAAQQRAPARPASRPRQRVRLPPLAGGRARGIWRGCSSTPICRCVAGNPLLNGAIRTQTLVHVTGKFYQIFGDRRADAGRRMGTPPLAQHVYGLLAVAAGLGRFAARHTLLVFLADSGGQLVLFVAYDVYQTAGLFIPALPVLAVDRRGARGAGAAAAAWMAGLFARALAAALVLAGSYRSWRWGQLRDSDHSRLAWSGRRAQSAGRAAAERACSPGVGCARRPACTSSTSRARGRT